MKTPIFASQIAKSLKVVDFWLTTQELVIQYDYNGNPHTISCNDLDAMELLKKYGIIEDCKGMEVKIIDEDGKGIWIEWQDYAANNDFSQSDALRIAIAETEESSINKWAEDINSIPSMTRAIFSSDSLFEQMANICKAHAKINYGIDLDPSKPAI